MKRYIAIILLAVWIVLILFLSFQNGTSTANTSFKFTKTVLNIFMAREPDYETIMLWDSRFRLSAHFVIFFLYGMISAAVAKEYGKKLLTAFIIGTETGMLLAVLSEVGKLLISGRHCDLSEMGLNVVGVWTGTMLITVIWKIYRKGK